MPHLIVEYSQNLDAHIDFADVLGQLHLAAEGFGVFEPKTIRSRAIGLPVFRIAGGDRGNGFVHLIIRIRPGRSDDVQWKLTETLLGVLKQRLVKAFETICIGLTVEIDLICPIRSLFSTLDPERGPVSLGRVNTASPTAESLVEMPS